MSKNSYQLVLLAGGTGSRMKLDFPKQFLKIGKETLIQRNLRIFQEMNIFSSMVLVSHKDQLEEIKKEYQLLIDEKIFFTVGGKTRHRSFLNGIEKLKFDNNDIIVIQDVARPFINQEDVKKLIQQTKEKGSATLASQINETIVEIKSETEKILKSILNRRKVYSIKTPQAIRGDVLKKALNYKLKSEPTDLCSWLWECDISIELVQTNSLNPKITNKEDLCFLENS